MIRTLPVGWLCVVVVALTSSAAIAQPGVRDPIEQQVEDVVQQLAREKHSALVVDHKLGDAVRQIAERLPKSGAPSQALVETSLWEQGFVEPSPHLVLAWGDGSNNAALIAELRRQLTPLVADPRYRRFGVGALRRQDKIALVAALQESNIELEPFARALAASQVIELRGKIQPGFSKLRALGTRPEGGVVAIGMATSGETFSGSFQCGPPAGRWQIEILADGRFGTTVLANFPIFCGVPATFPLPAAAMRSEAIRDPQEAERKLLSLIADERRRAGIAAVAIDPRLGQVARQHSLDMQRSGFVGHVSPRTGSASDRIKRAKFAALRLTENVARAYSVEDAHRGLMSSPGHRRNILDPEVDLLGIGVAVRDLGDRTYELHVTELFASQRPDPQE